MVNFGETRGGWDKVACWSTKATIYLKRVKIEEKPTKNLGEKGAWAYPGTAQFFEYPLLSQEQVKIRTSNFVRTFI